MDDKNKYGFNDNPSYIKSPLSYARDNFDINLNKIYQSEVDNTTAAEIINFDGVNAFTHDMLDKEDIFNAGLIIKATDGINNVNPINIKIHIDNSNDCIADNNIIIAEENASTTIVFDYSSDDDIMGYSNTTTKVLAKNGSHVKIVKIQRLGKSIERHERVLTNLEGNAKVEYINIEFGEKFGVYNNQANLIGDESNFTLKTIYLGDMDDKLSFNYTANHYGKNTNSEIDCKGTLMDDSKKVFTGKLDFKQGSTGSKGSEIEYVMMLNPSVKSTSIPILLCGEDDVEGEHAASAGQINENQLVYLMSRGLSESQAKVMIVTGYFNPILEEITNSELRGSLNTVIKERLKHA